MKYRRDIDGLRAVAVLPVIFYHLRVPGLAGGYIGVDIFFVISGFLITSLIAADIRSGRFSLLHFYERRIRRLLPALAIMIAVTMPISLLILLPGDLLRYAESLTATASFSSNILFWLEAGYFDAAAQTKPLLHTWSLAVEEQFYLLFPLVLVMLRIFPERGLRLVLVFFGAAAFAASLYVERTSPSTVFFLAPFRAWELLVGAVAATMPAPRLGRAAANAAATLGLLLILIVLVAGGDTHSHATLTVRFPAVLGALLILLSGAQSDRAAGPFLRSAPAVAMGKISYSAYLWHWPLIAFSSYYFLGEISFACKVSILCLTGLLSWVSYTWVEVPGRFAKITRRNVFLYALAATAVIFSAGLAGYYLQGLPSRFEAPAVPAGPQFYNRGPCYHGPGVREPWSLDRCTFAVARKNAPKVWLLGDSFGAHLFPGLRALQQRENFTLVQANFGSCQPLSAITDNLAIERDRCNAFNRRILLELSNSRPKLVIVSARWEAVRDQKRLEPALTEMIMNLHRSGIQVLVVGILPTYGTAVPIIDNTLRRRGLPVGRYQPEKKWLASDIAVRQAATKTKAAFFSPFDLLCRGDLCRYAENGKLLQWDFGHLSRDGSIFIADAMELAIKNLLEGPRPPTTERKP